MKPTFLNQNRPVITGMILKANLTFSTGYMYRFNPEIQEALEKIKNGELGLYKLILRPCGKEV